MSNPKPPSIPGCPCRALAIVTLAGASIAVPAQNAPPPAPPPAGQQPDKPPDKPPDLKLLRQNEDWSRFLPGAGAGPYDRLKHIALGDDGAVWLSLGGRADFRFESWDGFGFGATNPGNQDTFAISKLMLHADLHLGEHLRAYVEGRTAQATDRELPGGRRPVDMDTLDLFQAFVDVVAPLAGDGRLRLRAGRQSFLFGNQRLVSPLPWVNVWNAWDGADLQYRAGDWTIDGFYALFVDVDKTGWNESNEDKALYGVYASQAAAPGGRGVDLYLLGSTRPAVTVNGTSGDERRHTLGARSFGALGNGFDGELEGAYQFGEVGDGSVSAWFASAVFGYKLADQALQPRFFGGLDVASGDDRPGGSVGTFHQIYPLGHAFFGFADAIGRQNIAAAHLGVQLQVTPATVASVTGHVFRLFSTDDALYGVTGAVARSGLGSADVGQELDLLLTHRFHRHLDAYIGYSHLFAGRGIAASGPSEDQDFFYIGAAAVF